MFNSLLAFFFEKHLPSQVFKDFSVESLETTPSNFLSKFFSEIYLSPVINYWGSIFTLHLTWGAFSLVCVVSVYIYIFFYLSSFFLFFLFLLVFSLTETKDSQDSRDGRGNHCFSCYPLPPAHKHSFNSSRFLPFPFNQSICNCQIELWWGFFSLEICILFPFSLMLLSRKWHCEDLSSYQTITLLLQNERLNQLKLQL